MAPAVAPIAVPSTKPTATFPSAAPNTMPRATPMPTQDAVRFFGVLLLGLNSSGWDSIAAVGAVLIVFLSWILVLFNESVDAAQPVAV